MSFIPKPHEIYKHFKGNLYQVTAIAEHTETGEQLVIYQALYDEFKTYARPLSMFAERVDREKYPEVKQEFCFELQGPDAERQKAEFRETEPGKTAQVLYAAEPEKPVEARYAAEPEKPVETRYDTEPEKPEKVEASMKENYKAEPETEEELSIDPLVLEFLDADNYGQRLNIMAALHHRITDDMITTMAIACDVEINDGEVEDRYEALKTCLLTLEHYECNRLR